ncbi:Fumarylacetoacetate (FAA) hydrolase family protein [Vibrio vulnificus]|nr:Fumarylacetoacetate (FAA) hydrolase family protein [Vibrio vulnificus]
MKLATKKNEHRDGELIVVSRDLSRYVSAADIAPTLQLALDHWSVCEPKLKELYQALNQGEVTGSLPFEETLVHSPLPRAYQWADGSAYVNHVELVRKARGAEMPESFWTDPLMYQGGSDAFIAPRDNIEFASEEWGIDFEGEVAVITGPAATTLAGTSLVPPEPAPMTLLSPKALASFNPNPLLRFLLSPLLWMNWVKPGMKTNFICR